MLQQTRVSTAVAYYRRFLERFPTVKRLAASREQQVLAAWSGLGYYRRARMMHQAAREIVRAGTFPRSAEELRKLPGIGRYTAAAIASIAFGEAVAVVDGNVERVLLRLCGGRLGAKAAWEVAGRLLDPRSPGEFNEAMMELGATVCTPRSPACPACPLQRWCATRGEHVRTPPAPRKRAQLRFALHQRRRSFLLVQRDSSERLMPGMWELPAAATGAGKPLATVRHSITDTDYIIKLFPAQNGVNGNGRWLTPQAAEQLPLTGVTRKLLKQAGILGHPKK
jgi:A/G-specific adenine glycosylase